MQRESGIEQPLTAWQLDFRFRCLLHEARLELEQCCIDDRLRNCCPLLAGQEGGERSWFAGLRSLCKAVPVGDTASAQVSLLAGQQQNNIRNDWNVGPLSECGGYGICTKHMAWHTSPAAS